jgi:glycosyltransferase involved in cell wall biosynthesis
MSIACVFNFPSHYRENIYLKMEEELDCDFFFGDIEGDKIKKVDYSKFRKNIKNLKTIRLISHFNWIRGSIPLVFKPYKKYVLIGEPYCLSTWVILVLNRILGKQTYLWTHGWYGNETIPKKILKKVFFKLSHGIFLYGNYAKELMLNEGFSPKKLHVIFNSLNYEKQLKVRSSLIENNIYTDFFKNNNPVLVFIGRLTKVKKLHFALEVLSKLKIENIHVNMVFLGDGSEKEHLIQLTKLFNIEENCWFYGPVYEESEIGNLIFNSNICVSPGNIGLTAMHVLMYGVPIITHGNFSQQMPEFEAVSKGETGDFFEQDNIDDLKLMIIKWLSFTAINREAIRVKCFKKIDDVYNPIHQINLMKKVLL